MNALIAMLLMSGVQPSGPQPPGPQPFDPRADAAADYRLANPRAIELFERDARLMQWGLSFFDVDRDGRLSIREADAAAMQFKRIADGDKDGRVTPTEYRSARDFIVARWAVR